MRDPHRPDLSYALLAHGALATRAILDISDALRKARGNAVQAAHALGVDPRTMRRWLSKYPHLANARKRARSDNHVVVGTDSSVRKE